MIRERIIFITLFIFGLSVINNLFASKAEFEEIKKLEETEKIKPLETVERPAVEYKAGDLRDPFQETIVKGAILKEEKLAEQKKEIAVEKEITPPTLTVQGLVWGGNFPQAIINNKVVRIGDTIEGAKVISIDKEGINLIFEGMQIVLPSPSAASVPSIGRHKSAALDYGD
jgi:hypothetical protein